MKTRRMRRDLAAEIEAHISERADDLMEGGMGEHEAHEQARREFGNPTLIAETGGELWGWTWLERIGKDLRYAVRALRASPVFTVAAILSLALGIGANTAIFTLLYASLWKPLPVPAPGQLFQLWRHAETGPWTGDFGYSYNLFQELRQSGRPVGDVFATSSFKSAKFSADGVSHERASGESVSANSFTVLGVRPFIGRVFEDQDDSLLGGGHVAVLSYGFWMRRFHADPSVLGRTIFYDEAPYTVVGVSEAGFTGIESEADIDIWVPVTSSVEKAWLTTPNVSWLRVLVRLRPDTLPTQAQALFEKAFRAHVVEKLFPDSDAHWRPVLEAQQITMRPAAAGLATTGHKYEKPLLVLMALVGLVLLIACGNVANLVLARNSARQQEIAVRRALGATRWRIANQLFCESLLLSVAGAACGIALAAWGTRLLVSFLPTPEVPLAFNLRPGLAVLAFTSTMAVATAVLFGLLPAIWHTGGSGAELSLRAAQRVTRASLGGRLLVAGQCALSIVSLIGAGLFVTTLRNLKSANLGFRPQHVITFDLSHPKGASDIQLQQTYAQIKELLESHPGVMVASYAWPGIYGRGGWSGGVEVEGHASSLPPAAEDNETGLIAVGPGFFDAIGMRLLEGRYLNARDLADKPPAAVVNETFARNYFGAASPVGRHIKLAQFPAISREIVGVVRDARHYGVRDKAWRMVYLPARNDQGASFYIRMAGGASLPGTAIRTDVAAVDKTAEIEQIRLLVNTVDDMISQERLTAALSAVFGGLAAALAAVGLYGVVAYGVSRRTNEFGIRMAMGARPADVQTLVLRQTGGMVLAGVAFGVAAGWMLTRAFSTALAGMLYGIRPGNAVILTGAAAFLASVAGIAAFVPARRASRVDPVLALRWE